MRISATLIGLAALALPGAAMAAVPDLLRHQAPLALDPAATAWILTSTALVLLMTVPGLALFYGGMVRKKNVLATLAQSFAAALLITVLWFAVGYSLAFGTAGDAGLNRFVGSLDSVFLRGVGVETAWAGAPGLPEALWVAYQLTFAIITPALIAGAVAERMKFSAFLLFIGLWHLIVYAPVCHWVWSGGFLSDAGVLDFAGGAVVHVNSGVAGLVCAVMLGRRTGFGRDNMAPHNLGLTLIGAALLWVGWIGFNAGSAWAPDAIAAQALLGSLVAAATGGIGWAAAEWITRKQPTLLGLVSGAIAGLVAVTPAAGFVDSSGAFVIGLIGGVACWFAVVFIKRWLRYDDSLDVFGIHGVGGLVGAVLTGVFASAAVNPAAEGANVLSQLWGLGAVIAWSAVATFAILWVCKLTTGLRVSESDERQGLDLTQHGEAMHDS
ncbi:ammonium transporter [Brevundimonas lutea]|uniref:ammonium transporter n=1 Tax=Brevundimonas lutea TaxID=2293980 RepID=UPI000F037AFF|nr:ammonium transporter [Brevundimonas lutea]